MISKKARDVKYSPTTDAGLGLVYRLNGLWLRADSKCLAGDFDAWNFVLDRIYANLSYREELQLTLDKVSGKVIDVKQIEQQADIYRIFTRRIKKAKEAYFYYMKKRNAQGVAWAREHHYQVLMGKDMWLRKFMSVLGIYLKEFEYNPATAMFGGG